MARMLSLVPFCCFVAACASSRPLLETRLVAVEPLAPASEGMAPETAEEVLEDRIDLVPSKVTPWIERMADLALAVLRERPIPDSPFPFQGHALQGPLVSLSQTLSAPLPPVQIVGAVMPDIRMTLAGEPRLEGLELTLVLTRRGVEIASVRPLDGPRGCAPLPSDHPIHLTVQDVVEELREGRADPLLMTVEACHEILGGAHDCDGIPAQVDESLASVLEGLRADLTIARGPTSYRLEELILIARGPADEAYGLSMRFDCDDGHIEIQGEPLLRVRTASR